jgi:hypothetical protein
LRKLYDEGFQLFYFVTVVRTFTNSEFLSVRTNLLYSQKLGANTHTFNNLLDISIPDERYRIDTPWTEELKLLSDQKEKVESNDLFKDRFITLQSSADGLIGNLFWRSPTGKYLELNPGFVFFKFDLQELIPSQADIYFTIASILHHLRTEYKDGYQILLSQSENHCKILDPENFNRFNDPVIQASFLRAAQNIELDYSYDKAISKKMKDLIYEIVAKAQEASYEFLLALSVKKVKLTDDDMRLLIDKLYTVNETLKDPTLNVFLSIIQPSNDSPFRF